MTSDATIIGGIVIPSTDPAFLVVVIGLHIPLGITCVITGAGAMLSEKRRGRHSTFGTAYYWCLLALFASATLLSVMRWSENYHLFILGAASFRLRLVRSLNGSMALATLGKAAHHWDEHVVCLHADCLLRRQRKAIACLERPSSFHVLAVASCHRDATYHSSVAVAPVGAGTRLPNPVTPPRSKRGSTGR